MALTQVSTDGVKDDAVTAGKIPANAVGSSELADNAVDTAAIADDAVTAAKLASGVQTTINNNADNRVITGSGTANTLEGESALTFDGSTLTLSKTGAPVITIGSTNAGSASLVLDGDSNGDASGTDYAYLQHNTDGDLDIVVDNPADAGNIKFFTNSSSERLRIDSSGNVGIGKTPYRKLDINTSHYVVTSSGQSTTGIHLDGTHGNAGEYGGGISFGCGGDGSAAIAARQASASQHRVGLSFFTHDTTTSTDNAVEKVRLHDSGEVSFNNGICLGNSLTLAAANTLDDYEEGTWTPSVGTYGGVTGTRSFSIQNGYYVKIGRMVFCWMDWTIDSWSGGTGSATVYGLPFNKSFEESLSAYYSGLTVWWASNTVTGSKANITGWINENESHYRLYVGDTGESSALGPNFTGRVSANFVYTTSS